MMSQFGRDRRWLETALLAGTSVGLGAIPAPVFGQARTTVDVTLGAKVATNPFLVDGNPPTVGAATLQVDPSVYLEENLTTYRLDGSGRLDRYSKAYGTDASGRLALSIARRLSERTTLTLAGNGATTLGGVQDLFRVGDITDGQLPPDVINDVSTTGTRLRQYNYGANARLQSRLSARGNLDIGGGVAFSDLSGPLGRNLRQFSADAGYSHVLSDRVSVGGRFAFANVNYLGQQIGDGNIYAPSLTARFRLSERLSADLGAGLSFARIDNAAGITSRSTAFTAQASLCNTGERTNLCLAGSRAVQPTFLGGVSTVTSVSLRYDIQLAEYDRLSISGRYGRTNQPVFSLAQFGANEAEIYGANATYSRRLSERVYLTLSPSFSNANRQGLSRDANYQALVGIRIRFGNEK